MRKKTNTTTKSYSNRRETRRMKIAKIIKTNQELPLNLNTLLNTRLLLQANSGGEKSYALRKILEETHGKVQHIVLDMEGEFSSLREKYDYILVGKGKGADVQISIKTADMLARKILELKVSTIIDLYELKQHERILFVKRFLDSIVNAKKELWHPAIIVVDEAHNFCPQASKSESASSVIDLCTRGRKRGFCAVLATQRISKLHKDAAAECNNKMIGRATLDVDIKRAGEELGFTSKDDIRRLRTLKPGEYHVFGPAFTTGIVTVKINKVKTTHPDQNQRIGFKATPPTPKIKKLLSKIIDLPQKAEEELKEKSDFIKKIRSLEAQLRVKNRPSKGQKQVMQGVSNLALKEYKKTIKKLEKTNFKQVKQAEKINQEYQKVIHRLKQYELMKKELINWNQQLSKILSTKSLTTSIPKIDIPKTLPIRKRSSIPLQKSTKTHLPVKIPKPFRSNISEEGDMILNIGKCPKKIYNFLHANQERDFTKIQIALLTGYSPKSGGFNNALYYLNSHGLIQKNNDKISIGKINETIIT